MLAGSALAGAGTYLADFSRPFSSSREAAAFVRSSGLADLEIVGHTDFVVSPLAALLDKKLYYPERRGYGTFIVWNRETGR